MEEKRLLTHRMKGEGNYANFISLVQRGGRQLIKIQFIHYNKINRSPDRALNIIIRRKYCNELY